MKIEHLKRIIAYNNKCGEIIGNKVQEFYNYIGMESSTEFCNLIPIVKRSFAEKEFIIIELPFADKEIGALCYNGDGLGYAFLNTSLPKANTNFAMCHEIYHLFYQQADRKKQIDLYMNEHYYEHEEELAANLFASKLLMPEQRFCFMYHKFFSESKNQGEVLDVLAKLMRYFEVPYMAALIRCYELDLMESGEQLQRLLQVKNEEIQTVFDKLWLDDSILKATKRDDFEKFELFVRFFGEKYLEEGLLNKRTVEKALHNMRVLYLKIKGE